jgi:hypothetical protein
MWQNPMVAIASAGGDLALIDEKKFQEDFDEFYDEIFQEFNNFGKIDDVQVCENLGDHMVGNVYVKFGDEVLSRIASLSYLGPNLSELNRNSLKLLYVPLMDDFMREECLLVNILQSLISEKPDVVNLMKAPVFGDLIVISCMFENHPEIFLPIFRRFE